ncbi:pilus assembly protein PilM [Candidatus Omnitrophota bacterium]
MSEFGIYFGTEVISIAEFKGRKEAARFFSVPKTGLLKSTPEEKEAKGSKLASILKEAFAKNSIAPNNVNIALSGENLIIRTFDLPVFLSRQELEYPAIAFEAKKYIPFKIEEIVFDFRLLPDKKNKKILVLFAGIKNETLRRYFALFEELGIKIRLIEYSGFSILRLLDLSRFKYKGVLGLLSLDFQEETNFIVCQDGFPLFTRDITLTSKSQGEDKADLIKGLKSEIRISLDYFRRKFPTKSLQNLVILSPPEFHAEIGTLTKDLGLSAAPLEISKFLGNQIKFSSALLRSYSTAVSRTQKLRFPINLLKPAMKKEEVKGLSIQAIPALMKMIKINPKVALIAFLIIAVTAGWGFSRILPLENTLKIARSNQPVIQGISAGGNLKFLEQTEAEYTGKMKVMKEILGSRFYLTEAFDIIPYLMPQGAWLDAISFKAQENALELKLEGVVFLRNSNKEFEAVNDFILALKKDSKFSRNFREINVFSMERVAFKKLDSEVTKFKLLCR